VISAVGYDAGVNQLNYGHLNSSNDTEKMFTSLSIAMGGNGKSVSKSQLSRYIKDAQNGEINLGSDKLEALKNIEKKWDKLFGDKEKVSVKELKEISTQDLPLFVDESTNSIEYTEKKIQFYKEKNKEFQEFLQKIKAELRTKAEEKADAQAQAQKETQAKTRAKTEEQAQKNSETQAKNEENGITKKDLKDYLHTLIKKEPKNKDEEVENSDEIHRITNLIAEFDNITGGKEVMTSFEKKTEYTV